MQGVDRMFSHERDTMPGYEHLDGDFHDLDDASGNAGLVNSFQCEYQELGLDPVVSNLHLDRVHPTIQNLAAATQANAASSLMALHKSPTRVVHHHGQDSPKTFGRSRRPDVETSPSKRMRASSSSGIFTPKSRQWETPVRDRVDVDNSPSRGHGSSGFESPTDRDMSYSTPSTKELRTSPESSKSSSSRRGHDESRNKGRTPDTGGSSHRNATYSSDMQPPHTPDSVEGDQSPPPSATSKAKQSKARPRATPATAVSSIPVSVDKNKKDKGLREFSLRVCRQVEARMVTTYNEVADELVKEFKNDDPAGDEKNIRRRAYDALNVLTAMDIISKDKKDIQWKGFPCLSGDGKGKRGGFAANGGEGEKERLRSEIREKQKEIDQREGQLLDLSVQYLSLIQLLKRNERNANETVNKHRIYLPFVLVSVDSDNTIECDISNDKQTAHFNFTKPFELHDDRETLSMMKMYNCSEQELKDNLPPAVASFIKQARPEVTEEYSSMGAGAARGATASSSSSSSGKGGKYAGKSVKRVRDDADDGF